LRLVLNRFGYEIFEEDVTNKITVLKYLATLNQSRFVAAVLFSQRG